LICLSIAAPFLLSLSFGQNGLTDIPSTDPAVQQATFKLFEGAEINLFATDPQIKKPVHMNWDSQGRLWVVSSPLYPHIKPGQEELDQLIILEDADRDGVAEKSTVFAQDLHIPTGVLPGDGGVYVANSTELIFLKDTDGDDREDERSVVLSGFGTEDTHHLLHTLRWGPEGMLWMNQSIYIHTHLETPYGIRRLMGGGTWYFRPETQRAEIYMKGLVNPWGHAFDQWGQSFLTDGAGGEGINYAFPHSVHVSSPGASRVIRGLNPGQPKHCGLEILTGRHIPEALDQVMATPDFRGHRINLFKLERKGSSYTSTQIADLAASTHRAFRPIDIKMGPDGAIYVADWYNPIIQHGEVDFRDPRRDHKHGRIWRISFPDRDLVDYPKIVGSSPEELVALLDAPEGWTREQATAELRVRDDKAAVSQALEELTEPRQKVRAMWAEQALGNSPAEKAKAILAQIDAPAGAHCAALRALYYDATTEDDFLTLAKKALTYSDLQVRLWGVSLLSQLDHEDTVKIALGALDGVEVDNNLDFAVWNICRLHADRW
ncbi:MAG: PVC-type heme-binding CxxCH protein, partial [Verrucomicrobiota bacterium]